MPQQRRKSGLRTAAGSLQEQILARFRDLREDPTLVLPVPVGKEPAPLAKLRKRLERLKEKPATFVDRLNRGVLGAVIHTIALADLESLPRLLDMKIAGQRRFFVLRGHVNRMAFLGVQNFDDPRALIFAYADLAKKREYHFFAGRQVWCTGTAPQPPAEWLEDLTADAGVPLVETSTGRSCGHDDRSQVLLTFREGPTIAVCGPCGKKADHFHRTMAARYLGPQQRRPFEVNLRMPDDSRRIPEREAVARYRGGLDDEEVLLRPALADWRRAPGQRFVVAETTYPNQEAFLNSFTCTPAERVAITAMSKEGLSSERSGLAEILLTLTPKLEQGVSAILGPGAAQFVAERRGLSPRDLLRAATDEGDARKREAVLPKLRPSGPVGQLLDKVARAQKRAGNAAAVGLVRAALEEHHVGRTHLWAILKALGADAAVRHSFQEDERHAGDGLQALAKHALESEGHDYAVAVRAYLQDSGSGETA